MKPLIQVLVFFSVLFSVPGIVVLLTALFTQLSYKELIDMAFASGLGIFALGVIGLISSWFVMDQTDWDDLFRERPVPTDPQPKVKPTEIHLVEDTCLAEYKGFQKEKTRLLDAGYECTSQYHHPAIGRVAILKILPPFIDPATQADSANEFAMQG